MTGVIYRDDSLGGRELMQFRLVYSGPLRPTNRDAQSHQIEPLAQHKHAIRRDFHEQLRNFWSETKVLSEYKMNPGHFRSMAEPEGTERAPLDWGKDRFPSQGDSYPLRDLVAYAHREHGYEWVPLARNAYRVLCELDIILLRRDGRGSPLENGDLDNRVKTLIDCLKKPRSGNELSGDDQIPKEGETPFYVLLEDDSLVSRLNVETDRLYFDRTLFPKTKDRPSLREIDDRLVAALITVQIKAYYPSVFNFIWS